MKSFWITAFFVFVLADRCSLFVIRFIRFVSLFIFVKGVVIKQFLFIFFDFLFVPYVC